MGFMTEISIGNDAWDQIEDNPEAFVQGIKEKGLWRQNGAVETFPIGNAANYVRVAPTHHADDARVYIASGNSFVSLGEYSVEDELRERNPVDATLDYYENKIDEAIRLLENSKSYVRHLRDDVGYDERPGGPDYERMNSHHMDAWRKEDRRGV